MTESACSRSTTTRRVVSGHAPATIVACRFVLTSLLGGVDDCKDEAPSLSGGGKISEEPSSAEQAARGREDKQRAKGCTRRWSPSQVTFRSHDEFAHRGQ